MGVGPSVFNIHIHASIGHDNMGRKKSGEGVNKSQAIRDLLATNPKIKAAEAIKELKAKGIDVKTGLFYLVKGKELGSKRRTPKPGHETISAPANKGDAVGTILKVKNVAGSIGGLKVLKQIVDILSE